MTEKEEPKLILVDEKDQPIGEEYKLAAHKDKGKLHRAITVYLFNSKGEILITKRAEKKPLWPLFWGEAYSTHPEVFKNNYETYQENAIRRAPEELGIEVAEVSLDYRLRYKAKYDEELSENEIDAILTGAFDGELKPNTEEIAEYKWIEPEKLAKDISKKQDTYAPWFLLSIRRVVSDRFGKEVAKLFPQEDKVGFEHFYL